MPFRNTSLCRFLLLVVISFLLGLSAVQAESVIKDIKISRSEDIHTISIAFGSNKTPLPLYTGGTGWLRLDIQNTSFSEDKKQIEVNNGFISTIKLYRINQDVLMEVQFSDIFFTPDGRFKISAQNNLINIEINPSAVAKNSSDTKTIADQIRDGSSDISGDMPLFGSVDSDNSSDTSSDATLTEFDYDFKSGLFNLLLGLLLLLLLGYGLLYLLNRFGFKKFSVPHNRYRINVLNTKLLGPRQKIMIVEINNKKFACGVTKDHINYLTLVPDELENELHRLLKTPHMTVPALRTVFARRKREFAEQNNAKEAEQDNESVAEKLPPPKPRSFQEEFMGKIKNLKKIK